MSNKIQLRGSTWDDPRGYEPMVATAAAFQRDHPHVEIRWEKRTLHEFGHAAADELARNFDLVVLDHPRVGFIAATHCYLPLDKYIPAATLAELARHSAGPSHRSYQWDGHQWVLAIDAATPSASYRPDLLKNIPRTWADVLAVGRHGRLACPLGAVDAITVFLSLADNLGAQPFASRERVVDHAAGQRVLAVMQELVALCVPDTFELTPVSMMDRMSRTDEIIYCPLAYSYSNYALPGYRPHLCR